MQSDDNRPTILISYARSDGQETAAELRRRLEANFAVWQDLANMEGGKDWWRQITDAIDKVEYLVLVVTTGALASKVVRDEWQYARQQGTCVIPVRGESVLDYSPIAGWMRRAHFVDYKQHEQWTRLVRTLESPCESLRVPFMVEDLPRDFVARRKEFDPLIGELLKDHGEEPNEIIAALSGAGGFGKTTLARAVCHDERVRDTFYDGILWLTLGKDPGDLCLSVSGLIYALTGQREDFLKLELAINRFTELLADRRMLIVIDDVWNAAHLGPFTQGGPNCARLITTRNLDTLPSDAYQIHVDAMEVEEAVELLFPQPPADQADALRSLAYRVGKWPLLLKLTGSTLAKKRRVGDSLGDAIAYASKAYERKGPTGFDARNPEQRDQAVAVTLALSLDQLDADERTRFTELAIFPRDVDLPLATLEVFWGLDDLDTEDLCQRLFELSLLSSLDLATRKIRLHEVLRTYLRGELNDDDALRQRLSGAYRQVVKDSYLRLEEQPEFFRTFYEHLFCIEPDLRAKFQGDWQHAVAALRSAMRSVMQFWEERRAEEPTILSATARNHKNLDLSTTHFDMFEDAFIYAVNSNEGRLQAIAWRSCLAPGIAYMKAHATHGRGN